MVYFLCGFGIYSAGAGVYFLILCITLSSASNNSRATMWKCQCVRPLLAPHPKDSGWGAHLWLVPFKDNKINKLLLCLLWLNNRHTNKINSTSPFSITQENKVQKYYPWNENKVQKYYRWKQGPKIFPMKTRSKNIHSRITKLIIYCYVSCD